MLGVFMEGGGGWAHPWKDIKQKSYFSEDYYDVRTRRSKIGRLPDERLLR